MALPRVIPVLLLRNRGLVKTVRFKDPKYIGDPFNAVKIFNEKEVDELIILDIDASIEKQVPQYDYLKDIASECFMPLTYGGAVSTTDQIKRLIKSGIEKVCINTQAIQNADFVKKASDEFGASTIIGAIDVKKNIFGQYYVYSHVKKTLLNIDVVKQAVALQKLGIGELFINNVDQDGMMQGYDINLIKRITSEVDVPVIACGGAGSLDNLAKVIHEGHASAAAAGSFFVFHGKHRAVLVTYPDYQSLKVLFSLNA